MKTKSRAAAIPLLRLTEEQAALAGGKAASLASLARAKIWAGWTALAYNLDTVARLPAKAVDTQT